jgi:Starch binding domain
MAHSRSCVCVLFVHAQLRYGERIAVVGNCPQLGEWNVAGGAKLTWHEGDVWAAELQLPVGVDIEFKVCVRACVRCLFVGGWLSG